MRFKIGDKVRIKKDCAVSGTETSIEMILDNRSYRLRDVEYLWTDKTVECVHQWVVDAEGTKHGCLQCGVTWIEHKEQKATLKFKVGDIVRIRGGLIEDKIYDNYTVVEKMLAYAGKEAAVTSIDSNDSRGTPAYRLKGDAWHWTDGMVECVHDWKWVAPDGYAHQCKQCGEVIHDLLKSKPSEFKVGDRLETESINGQFKDKSPEFKVGWKIKKKNSEEYDAHKNGDKGIFYNPMGCSPESVIVKWGNSGLKASIKKDKIECDHQWAIDGARCGQCGKRMEDGKGYYCSTPMGPNPFYEMWKDKMGCGNTVFTKSRAMGHSFEWYEAYHGLVETLYKKEAEMEKTKKGALFTFGDACSKTLEEKEMEKPVTKLEKDACKGGRKRLIDEVMERKKEEYYGLMKEFYGVEQIARTKRKEADELRKTLCVTDAEMKQMFEE